MTNLKKETPTVEPKAVLKKVAKEIPFTVEKKIADIQASKMPDYQKKELIESLTGKQPDLNGVPFNVWANVRSIRESVKAGMAVYATSKGVSSISLAEWDDFFINF